jgi:anionic cell wall polymer biosynthesis LytR-Cps2A-Psr (LCP) family protein
MNIRDYYTVNFSGLADIIDGVGGLEINVKKSEIDEINKYMREVARIKKQRATPITKAGIQRLNGKQAVAYARIRKVGNGDFDRTERQKEVLTALIVKIQNQGTGKYPYIISKMLPYVETSMSKTEIVRTGTDVFTAGISNIEWCRFPINGYYKGKIINKAWYLVTDIKATKKHLYKFIYEDVNPTKK